MLAPSLALARAGARASVAALRCPIFAPGKIVAFIICVHLRSKILISVFEIASRKNPLPYQVPVERRWTA
jgi:hypothetical protein